MLTILIFSILLILLLVGFLGIFFPVLPGILFMFLVALIFAISENFNRIGVANIIIFGLITIISLTIDYLSGFFGAKFFGATRVGALGGLLGSLVGLFIFPPFGLFIGLILGVLAAEILISKKTIKHSARSAGGAILGSLTGILINVLLGLTFLTYFIITYWS